MRLRLRDGPHVCAIRRRTNVVTLYWHPIKSALLFGAASLTFASPVVGQAMPDPSIPQGSPLDPSGTQGPATERDSSSGVLSIGSESFSPTNINEQPRTAP